MEHSTNTINKSDTVSTQSDVDAIIEESESMKLSSLNSINALDLDPEDYSYYYGKYLKYCDQLTAQTTRKIVNGVVKSSEYDLLFNYLMSTNSNSLQYDIAYKHAVLLNDLTILRRLDIIGETTGTTYWSRFCDIMYLDIASRYGNIEALKFLLNKQNQRIGNNNASKALYCAIAYNQVESAKLLIEWDFNLVHRYKHCTFKNPEMCELFS